MSMSKSEYVEKLEKLRREITEVAASLTCEDLEKPASFDVCRSIRLLLYRMCTHDLDHAQQIAITREPFRRWLNEAELIVSRAAVSRGNLYATLIGLSDSQLYEHPIPGQWSIAEILDHVVAADERRLREFRLVIQKRETRGNQPKV
jgi:hypothetical protein